MSSSSIQCERILTANLPTGSVPGEKFIFDAETPDSTEVGMSITNSKGKLLNVVDKSSIQKLANMQQQINVLEERLDEVGNEKYAPTLLEGLTQGQWCSNVINKVGNTLTFRLNFTLPSTWDASIGHVIFYLPPTMHPSNVIHIFDDTGTVAFDLTQSGACVLYGGVAREQYVFNSSTII